MSIEIGAGDPKGIMTGTDSSIFGDAIASKGQVWISSATPQKKEGEGVIGDDVKRVMEAIEKAGLCPPKLPEKKDGKNTAGKNAKGRTSSMSNLPRTAANGTRNRALSRTGTASSKGSTPTTKSRPSTKSSISVKSNSSAYGVSGIPPKTATNEKGLKNSRSLVTSATKANIGPATATATSATTNKTPNEKKKQQTKSAWK